MLGAASSCAPRCRGLREAGCRLSPGGHATPLSASRSASRPPADSANLGGEPGGRSGPRGASAIRRVTSPAAGANRARRARVAAHPRPSWQVPGPSLARPPGDRGPEGVKAAGLGPGPGLGEALAVPGGRDRSRRRGARRLAGGRAFPPPSRLLLCSEFPAPLPPPAPSLGPLPSLPFFLPRLPAAKEAHLL